MYLLKISFFHTQMSRKPRNRVWYQWNGLKDKSPCCLCESIMKRKARKGEEGEWHVEHVWAQAFGGPDLYPNLLPICKDCNLGMEKGCKSTFHHLANKGFITLEQAESELVRHRKVLERYDPQCTALTATGKRCRNHKCGRNEDLCYVHIVKDARRKLKVSRRGKAEGDKDGTG